MTKKGKIGIKPQGEQIETALLFHPGVDGFQFVAEFALHPVAQHEAGGKERQGRAEGGSEGDDDRSPQQPEDRAGGQGHDGRAGQR